MGEDIMTIITHAFMDRNVRTVAVDTVKMKSVA